MQLLYVCACVCVYARPCMRVCVCERERGREREIVVSYSNVSKTQFHRTMEALRRFKPITLAAHTIKKKKKTHSDYSCPYRPLTPLAHLFIREISRRGRTAQNATTQ